MKTKLNSILLIDDQPEDNLFHSIIIEEAKLQKKVSTVRNGIEALQFLTAEENEVPNLIFLDYAMPKMNGKEFITAFDNLDLNNKSDIKIVMLSSTLSPFDMKEVEQLQSIDLFKRKPLTTEMLVSILQEYFN